MHWEEKIQLFLETYYFRMPKQLKGLNKEISNSLGTSFDRRKVFYENTGTRIYYYPSNSFKKFNNWKLQSQNVFLVYATINRPYILDLFPGNSLREFLCREGFNVFLLEWVEEPECENLYSRSSSIEKQIFYYMMDSIYETMKTLEIDKINLAGYCQGGTYALVALYFYPELFERAVLYNTPVDFDIAGLFQPTKFIPKFFIDFMPMASVPFQLTDVPTYPVDNLLSGKLSDPFFNLLTYKNYKWLRAVNKWENDAVSMPKNVLSEWLEFFYQENRLVNNDLSFYGKKIELEEITTPVLSIVAEIDDIAPKVMAAPIKTRLPNGKELCVPGGHLSTTAGSFAIKHSWPATANWFRK